MSISCAPVMTVTMSNDMAKAVTTARYGQQRWQSLQCATRPDRIPGVRAARPAVNKFSERNSSMTSSSAPRAVVIYSGGMDSYTVLHRARREGYELHALSFNYGQRHARELDTAKQVCEELGIAHQIVDIRAIHGLIGIAPP